MSDSKVVDTAPIPEGADEVLLARLGYKQEFKREIGIVANIGMSLTAIGVLTGMSSAFQTGLLAGGPLTLFWAWNIVSVFMFFIALSQAEICSAFPTMGGLYFWVCKLVPEKYVSAVGYITGNLYAWGMVFTGVSGNLSTALYIASLVQVGSNGSYSLPPVAIVFIAWAVNIVSGILNTFGMRAIGRISAFNVWFTLAGTVVLFVTLFAASPQKNTAEFAFFHFENYSGWENNGFVFMLGFLQAVYSLEGSETSAQIAEEAKDAARTAPIAIASSIAGSWFVGLLYLIALNFNVQSIPNIATTSFAIPIAQLYYDAVGRELAILCLFVILLAQWAASLTAWTASSRLFFALSRDSAFPGKKYFMALTSTKTPYYGIWLSVVVGCVIHLTFLGSPVAFNAILSSAAISVLLAYAMPMICRVIWPDMLNDSNRGPISLGKFSFAINLLGAAFALVMSVFFILPTVNPVTPLNMNYAVVALFVVVGFIVLSYVAWGRKVFAGPIREVEMSEEDITGVLGSDSTVAKP
ncbi:amino acid transporter [Cladochytrium replicatum]|nr:amino acid transporter [Cladochytrium replicatum]